MSRTVHFALAFSAISASAAVFGCSAQSKEPAAPAQEKVSDAAPYLAQPGHVAGAAPQMTLPSTLSLAEEEAAFELAEKHTGFAIEGKSDLGQPLAAGADRCTTVCKALASMRASAEHICQLDATRCNSVKERVERSEKRAKDACPTCAAPT